MAKAKKIPTAKIKLQITAGQATPQPPVGPALGQHQVPIMEFINRFNEKTRDIMGTLVPVEIFVYKDRSFDFIVKSPPAAVLLKKHANLAKGSPTPNTLKVGTVTEADLEEIAKVKMDDLNAGSMEAAKRLIAGTARSMGIKVVEPGETLAPAEEASEDV